MRLKSMWTMTGVLAATVALAIAVASPVGAQDTGTEEKQVLRIGWAQDPATLNPFTEVNEEGFNVWALNWDLLVNFSPEPQARPRHRRELGGLRGPEERHLQA